MTDSLLADLRALFRTKGRAYIYIANGHGAWEAALTNVLSRGDKVLVLESGRFALGWGEAAAKLGCEIEVLPGDWRRAVRPAEVEARLRRDRGRRSIKAILAVQIDTASGVVNDIAAIGKAVRAAGHEALLMVDAVASLGSVPFEMDDWGVDIAMAGSQKGLMTPPGLGFVAAGPRARAAHQRAGLRTPYWDWTARDGKVHYLKYAGTPPEHLLFALRQAIDMSARGRARQRIPPPCLLAEAVRRAVAVWCGRRGVRASTSSSRRTLRHGHHDPDARPVRSRCSSTIATANAASCSARASASSTASRSASPIWGMSMRPWCWARSAWWKPRSRRWESPPQGRRPGGDRLARRARQAVSCRPALPSALSAARKLKYAMTNNEITCNINSIQAYHDK